MLDQAQLNTIRSYFEQAHTITIVCGVEPSVDILSAVSVLNQALKSAGKEVQLISPKKLSPEVITGLESVETSIGKQNLVVSFPYEESAVDKVSYHIGEDSGRFFLTIKPQKGQEPLDSKKVEFSYAGVESDLVILVGVSRLESLEQLYVGYEEFYQKTPKISFSTNGSSVGDVNISSTGYSSVSECLLVLLNSLQMDFSSESATNLLSAIDLETDYMRSLKASAITFEAVAQLMRLGARRIRPEITEKTSEADAKLEKGAEITISKPKSENQNQDSQDRSKKSHLKKRKQKPLKKQTEPGGLNYDPSRRLSKN